MEVVNDENTIPPNVFLGVVSFNNIATRFVPMTLIMSKYARDFVIQKLNELTASRGTAIGTALEGGIKVNCDYVLSQ